MTITDLVYLNQDILLEVETINENIVGIFELLVALLTVFIFFEFVRYVRGK